MRAYRRRKAEQRITDAAERRKRDEAERRAAWTRVFLSEVPKLSQTQTQKLFHLLDNLGRLDGLPWEQQELDVG